MPTHILQRSDDGGKTWFDLPYVTLAPYTHGWIDYYSEPEAPGSPSFIKAYHLDKGYERTRFNLAESEAAALADECEWRNAKGPAKFRVINQS